MLEEQVEPLHVFLCAERKRRQGLRLATGEERRAVDARQHAHFAGDRPDLIERATVRAPVREQNVVAEVFFAEPLKRAHRKSTLLFFLFGDRVDDFLLQRVHKVVALFLRMLFRVEGVVQPRAVLLFDLGVELVVEGKRSDNNLCRIKLRVQLANGPDDALDLRMGEFESVHDGVLGNFERSRFHHHDGVFRARYDNVQQARFLLGHGRVGDQLAVQKAHAHGRDRFVKWEIGAIGRR